MVFPIALDNLSHTTNNSTPANATLFDAIIDAINNAQAYIGISSAVQNAAGTLTERINFLLNAPGGIVKQTTAPVSPATDDLWIDTSTTDRPLEIFYSSAWHYIGANALKLQSRALASTAPTNGQVMTWDNAGSTWKPATPTGGMTSPFIAAGDTLYAAPTTFAPAALTVGTPGQIYAVSSGSPPLPQWINAPYVVDPTGAAVGQILMRNASNVWTHLDPGTSGYAITSNGPGAIPSYQAIPVTPPGASITAPAGLRVGSLIQYDGSAFIAVTPGTAGQYLTAHGDSNTNPAALLTWTTISTFTNPMTAIGSLIKGDTGGAPLELLRPTSSGDYPDSLLGVTGGTPVWRKLGGMKVDTYLDYLEQGSDPAAIAGGGLLYTKTDHHLYFRESGGTIHDLLAAGTGYSTIDDEGSPLTARSTLDFIGAGVTAADGTTKTNVTIPGYYSTVKSDATTMTQRHALKLIAGTGVTLTPVDNSGSDQSEITIAASGGGGGGGGSRLSRTTSGLLFFDDFSGYADQSIPASAGPGGWVVRATVDAGTFVIRQGRLVNTSHGNFDRCSNMTPSIRDGVFEGRYMNPTPASMYVGMRFQIQSGADTDDHTLNKSPSDCQLDYRTAGTEFAQAGAAFTFTSETYFTEKVKGAMGGVGGAHFLDERYLDGKLIKGPNFDEGTSFGPRAAGGVGFIVYNNGQTTDGEMLYMAVYSDFPITVAGLSGTEAVRLVSKWGSVLLTSSAQSGGTATLNTAPLPSGIIEGYLEVHTSAAFTNVISGGRFPAEGLAVFVGGDTWTYV